MKTAVYSGSFDPFTLAHADILKQACSMFDSVVVGILVNEKKTPTIAFENRILIINKYIELCGLSNCSVEFFSGLMADFVKEKKACAVVRGIRNGTDLDYEIAMADINRRQNPDFNTIFLMSDANNRCISSSAVRELSSFGGNISDMIPEEIYKDVLKGLIKK